MKMVLQLAVLSFSLMLNAQSLNAATPGAYLGGGLGFAQIDIDNDFQKMDDNVLGGRVFLGYNFNKYFGVETNYAALNTTRFYDWEYPYIIGNYKLNALSLVGKLYAPLTNDNTFNAYVLLGAAQMWGTLNFEYQSRSFMDFSASETVPTAGLGLTVDLTQRLTAGFEVSGFAERAYSDRLGVPGSILGTLSLAYKFQ